MKYVIAIGSNTDSENALMTALSALCQYGEVVLSSVIVGRDFTGKTEQIYHNAVCVIELFEPCDYEAFNEVLKGIEKLCGRHDNQCVPMDLDILAYECGDWCMIKKRLPFKAHEKMGLSEVAPYLLTKSDD